MNKVEFIQTYQTSGIALENSQNCTATNKPTTTATAIKIIVYILSVLLLNFTECLTWISQRFDQENVSRCYLLYLYILKSIVTRNKS